MEQSLIQSLEDFLGGRYLPTHLETYLKTLRQPLDKTLYRGMNYPIHLIQEGAIVEEWHGSTHWSKEFQIAQNFAYDGYINEDYVEELQSCQDILAEQQVTKAEDLFHPIVFRLKENTQAIDISTLIKDVKALEIWRKEQEVNFIGVDFRIESYQLVEGENPYYLIDVKELEKATYAVALFYGIWGET